MSKFLQKCLENKKYTVFANLFLLSSLPLLHPSVSALVPSGWDCYRDAFGFFHFYLL